MQKATKAQLKYWKSLVGRVLSPEHRKSISNGCLGNKNSLGRKQTQRERDKRAKSLFKGENVCKRMKHRRIEDKYGTPKYCECCKRTDKKKYEWANKDHKYNLKKIG